MPLLRYFLFAGPTDSNFFFSIKQLNGTVTKFALRFVPRGPFYFLGSFSLSATQFKMTGAFKVIQNNRTVPFV